MVNIYGMPEPDKPNAVTVKTGGPVYMDRHHPKQSYRSQQRAAAKRRRQKAKNPK